MNKKSIQEIGERKLNGIPLEINRMTIGMCNEVYELKYKSNSFILRMNKEKEWIYGTHKFLPLFQKLQIKTPKIVAEDYSKTEFQFCYQIQTKLEGKDLGLVIHKLNPSNLKQIAKEVSNIFDKFNSFPYGNDFGMITGLNEEKYENLLVVIENQRKTIIQRNKSTNVIDKETKEIHNKLLKDYNNYFLGVKPKLYYDDICSKNVLVHNGEFNGLVDLDFLMKGDYLEAIGRMIASWHGDNLGEIYIQEIIKLQNLNEFQQKIIRVYAILNLILWTSEEGIKFNSNSTGEINWLKVGNKKRKILELFNSLKE